MIYFETGFIELSALKPKLWVRIIEGILIIWRHGWKELQQFFEYMNSQHHHIQFTLKLERNNSLPFLDILVRKLNIYGMQEVTNTNRYLNVKSHYHPTQLQAVTNTLISNSIYLTHQENEK